MNRRDLLKHCSLAATGLGLAGGLASPADAEEVRARVKTASEPSGLRITDLRVVPMLGAMRSHVIRLDTNQGIHGYGEIRDGASPTYALMLKSRILGENPCHVDKIFRKLKQFGGHGRQAGGVVALEIACWDLAGKAWGVPCWQMLGGKFRDRIRIYADTHDQPGPAGHGPAAQGAPPAGIHLSENGRRASDCSAGSRGRLRFLRGRASIRTPNAARPLTTCRIPSRASASRSRGLKRMQEYMTAVREIVGLGHPLGGRSFRAHRRRGRHQAGPGAGPLQSRLAGGHDPLVLHGRLRAAEELLQDADPHRRGHLPQGGVSQALPEEGDLDLPSRPDDLRRTAGDQEDRRPGDGARDRHGDAHGGSPVGLFASVHCAAATENFLVLESHDVDNPSYDDLVDGVPKPLVKDGFVQRPRRPGAGHRTQ